MHDKTTPTPMALVALTLAALACVPATHAAEVRYNDCGDYDNEKGFGGTTVACDLSCGAEAVLTIAVSASDNEADVEGKVECADAAASCSGHEDCVGASRAMTTSPEDGDGNCWGRTHEFSDSGITISCSAAGAAVGLCQLIPDAPVCGQQGRAIRALCLQQVPRLDVLDDLTLKAMFKVPGGGVRVERLVAAHQDADGGAWVSYRDGQCRGGDL